jgi:hypothetical protein
VSAPQPPPRPEGLAKLAPELTRIVEALARAAEERDYRASQVAKQNDDPSSDLRPL